MSLYYVFIICIYIYICMYICEHISVYVDIILYSHPEKKRDND